MATAWGSNMGKEFFDKGSNVILGPGMNVARVPRNGRNFEVRRAEGLVWAEGVATKLCLRLGVGLGLGLGFAGGEAEG